MKRCMTAGFGGTLGPQLLAEIKARGYQMVRNGDFDADAARLRELTEDIWNAGLTACISCTTEQIALMPLGVHLEVWGSRSQIIDGKEPNGHVLATEYAQALNAVAKDIGGRRAWACLTGLDADSLAWATAVCKELDPAYGISVHRYPPGNAFRWDASIWGGRGTEIVNLRHAIGNRPWMVGEWGWDQGPRKHWYDYLLFRHTHLTDAQIDVILETEWTYWEQAGAEFACLYQLNDGNPRCKRHPQYAADGINGYGRRFPDGRWKR
jgi:hypothetical protein